MCYIPEPLHMFIELRNNSDQDSAICESLAGVGGGPVACSQGSAKLGPVVPILLPGSWYIGYQQAVFTIRRMKVLPLSVPTVSNLLIGQ